jgi:hypothetical protein
MNKPKKAAYKKHNISAFNNNPYIEVLRPAMDIKTFVKKIKIELSINDDVKNLDDFDRELMIELLDTSFIPAPEMYTLYKSIVKSIMVGYLHRNPVNVDTDKIQHCIATDEGYQLPDKINLSSCIAYIGLSGGGKTVGIEKCFSLLDQVINHNGYKGEYLNVHQIVYLKFEAPSTKTKKGFVLNFFNAIDEAIGSQYYEIWKKDKSNIAVLIIEAKKIAFNHGVGIVFIDEIQRCVGEDSKVEKATLSFIDDFFNSIGIPMIVAGTYAVMPLYRTTMSTSRRLSSGRVFECEGIQQDFTDSVSGEVNENPFWHVFVDAFYKPQLLKNHFEFDNKIKDELFYFSQGIQKLLVRLIKLSYEEAVNSGLEAITPDLIRDVYFDQFKLLHPALDSLRKGEYGGYEDLIKDVAPKAAGSKIVDMVIEKCISSKSSKAPVIGDDGVYIDVPAAKQTFIPKGDLRNLSGLDRDGMIDGLYGDQK